MGGRGTSSAGSGGFSTGDRAADAILSGVMSKYKHLEPETKLAEKVAERTLANTSGDPIGALKSKAKLMVENHERDLREAANYKKDIASREAAIAKNAAYMKSVDKGSKIVNVRGVEKVTKGNTYESLQLAQSRREKGLMQAHREQGAREKAIKNFKSNFEKEMDTMAKQAYKAANYKKKKRK